ncbi:MAG: TetR/AcrR family transcriptional regulator [Anaerolineae bacterium]|jgi:AcrR family transcriptional regulator|nr:TetR/AcrR family transcriptional regulator [Anaerolineae bacterium]MBT4459223.1 TetR/AcrR family transcriptional regulator [Anaerolineae bacterium]MBT6061417.1 TetR/AcrR family transcriptional regulator [Anaerolineae bacterium]MBT6322463.1 TetR/AcrR family transcriptional regulator [Anaerolineae bacterium]MBT6814353.1 TetR/AcrR family transcriptional regulator [Anaerolineae bacterium]
MVRTVKKPEERRQEIILAAAELFRSKGYEKTTMQNVMDAVGIAKGTIYHYFKSKEDLLEAVIEQSVVEYLAGMQTTLDESSGNALDKMRLLITSGQVADEQEEILEHLHRPGNAGMQTRQLAVTISGLAPLYAKVIQQGCDEGVFQTEYPLESGELLLTGIQFLTDLGIHPWSQEELIRRAMAFPALIEAQLRAPKGSFNFLIENLTN